MPADSTDDPEKALPDAYYRQQEANKPLSRLRRRVAPIKLMWDKYVGDGTD